MKLVVIDPRVTAYAAEADLHAQLRPGTDGALALGLLHVIVKEGLYDKTFVDQWTVGFDHLVEHLEAYTPERVEEITWVPAETTRKIARLYATTRPACISPRNALDQHTNASCAIRAIDILMAVTGNLDVKGGNIMVLPLSMAMKDMKLYDKLSPEAEARKIGVEKSLHPSQKRAEEGRVEKPFLTWAANGLRVSLKEGFQETGPVRAVLSGGIPLDRMARWRL